MQVIREALLCTATLCQLMWSKGIQYGPLAPVKFYAEIFRAVVGVLRKEQGVEVVYRWLERTFCPLVTFLRDLPE